MLLKRLLRGMGIATLCLIVSSSAFAQKTITGKINDSKDGAPLAGVSITVKGTSTGTTTKADGTFSLTVPANATTLVVSSVGYATQEVNLANQTSMDVLLVASGTNLNEVVVVGYGTARKKDLTGAVSSVQSKDFVKGPVTNPDQLLIGKVSGLQIINSTGQPGAVTIVKIRGTNSIRTGNNPLYVVDGVPLDGRTPRPGLINSGLGTTPSVNPLTFINPNDIASMDVLKDASSAAIYGSRGANGVIIITTKKGQAGTAKVFVDANFGVSDVMRKIKVLDAGEYRQALKTYNAPKSDSGASVDPFDEILHKGAPTQNYSIAFSGGSENGRYRASFLYSDQQGIIRKSGLKKYVGSFNEQHTFLDKKLSLNFNVTAANVTERIAPITQDVGSQGNIISLALIWNPTLALKRSNGLYNQTNPSGQVNPLALSDAYNDGTSTTTLLGSFGWGYKITPELEYRGLLGLNYSTSTRKQEIQGWIVALGNPAGGSANVGNGTIFSETVTHTLNYTKQITSKFNLNAIVGYEYWKTSNQGSGVFGSKFDLNQSQSNITPHYHYYDNIQGGDPANRATYSFKDPSVELQSYFARATVNWNDLFLVTATFRADGSSKFGSNNQYAYFPSAAAAWNITNMGFMKGSSLFNSLKLRVGYGQTGNQEFNPVDAALQTQTYNSYNNSSVNHYGNADLKWETVSSVDVGADFTILHNRLRGSLDYFDKKTKDPILDFAIAQPTAGTGTIFLNMDGTQAQEAWVKNTGFEVAIGAAIIEKANLVWNVNANGTFVKNKFESPDLSSVPFVKNTGALHGQGTSGAYSEAIANGQPIDVFYLPVFPGFDKTTGVQPSSGAPVFSGDPNPSFYYGLTTDVTYKKWTFSINAHGNVGNKIYNNTAMSVLNISNIIGGRNIASNLVGNGESPANAITPSTRFLENGDFFKLGNATINYNVGNLGRFIKNGNIYLSGNNLFVITKYNGFDPEVNIDKALNGIPSLGVDYIGYPTARTIVIGVNFSL
ncbi:MAG: SusC/RagA family TonB-linked outer membrane protein [Bacteroidetes bacterium]|nr:MAG: SusC/RagA family TonB-linked outer membrane protein [Bacteroidota bacterium]